MIIKPVKEVIPQRLSITQYALYKALTYARLVVHEYGETECIGYLLTDRERGDLLVDDVLLAPHQEATASSVKLGGSAVLTAGREIQVLGKRAVGWWHSHNSMAAFHSSVDDENTEQLLNELAPANLHYARTAMPLNVEPSENGLRLCSGSRVLGMLTNDQLTNDQLTNFQRVESVGVVFSLVVNVRGQTYAEVATKRWCGFCQREEVQRQRVPLHLVRADMMPALDIPAMRHDVRRKVRVPMVRWSLSPKWQRRDEDRWRRLVQDTEEETEERRKDDGADASDDGVPPCPVPTGSGESEADAPRVASSPSVAEMFEHLLTELRELKTLMTTIAQNRTKEPSP